MAALDRSINEFSGDPTRLYLTGFSMGGTGAYRIAFRSPTRFAAMMVVAGRIEHGNTYTAEESARDSKDNPFIDGPDPFAALADRIKALPIWIFHGDSDRTVPVEQSRKVVQALTRAGSKVQYTEYPGLGHGDASARAHAEAEMIRWLLAQHR